MEKRIVQQKITPNLWFDNRGEEAVNFYVSIFKNAGIGPITRYGKEGYEIHKMPEGTVMTIEFKIEGQEFIVLNGGPLFKFNEAISFIINCENQEEIDYYWEKLSHEGDEKAQVCGWLKDKFGVSWQVVPTILAEMFRDSDKARTSRVFAAMLKMKKIDIRALEEARDA